MDPECEESSKVNEEAILDSLFYSCDPEDRGRVPVSRLIEYLRSTICGESGEFGGNIDDLSLLLDPEGKDVEIDIGDFQTGLKEWIQDIRKQSFMSGDEEYHSPIVVNCSESPIPLSSSRNNHLNHVDSAPNASSDSVEGVGGESPLRFDWEKQAELTNTIDELQLNNRRLIEQHTALKTQLEGTEDTNSQLANEVENLKKQLRSTQLLVEKSKTVEKENTELRQAVDEIQESVKKLECKNMLTEKERHALEMNVMELGVKLSEAYSNVDNLNEEKETLLQVLSQQKLLIIELEDFQEAKDELSKESSNKSDRMSSVIAELSLANEELKTENQRLKAEFSELNDELYKSGVLSQDGVCIPQFQLKVKVYELSKNNSQMHNLRPTMASTPFRKVTLLQELQAETTNDAVGLPSPLVGSKPNLSDSVNSDVFEVSMNTTDRSWLLNTSIDSVSTTASMDRFSLLASHVANEFKEKREQFLKQVEELGTIHHTPEIKNRQEGLRQLLARDVDMFTEKVAILAKEKKAEKKRVAKLLVAIKKMREESRYLREERDRALQKLGNLSLCSDELDSRVAELKKELAKEKAKVKDMEDKIRGLEDQLVPLTRELEKARKENEDLKESLDVQTQQKKSLQKKLEDMSRDQKELEKLQAAAQVRVRELEWEVLELTSQLKLERRRTSSLEDSLSLSVSRHTEELHEINDLIPTTEGDAFNRTRQSPRCSSPIITAHNVRMRLQDYLESNDAFKSILAGVRHSPDGGPLSELEENIIEAKQSSSQGHPGSPTRVDKGSLNGTEQFSSEDPSADSLDPVIESQSPNLVHPFTDYKVNNSEDEESLSTNIVKQKSVPKLICSSSQTDMSLTAQQTQTDFPLECSKSFSDIGVLTDPIEQAQEVTDTNLHAEKDHNKNINGYSFPSFGEPVTEAAVVENASGLSSEPEAGLFDKKQASDGTVAKKRNLWKKTLSFRASEEYESYTGENLRSEAARNSENYFIEGVSMHVKPPPSDKEIEKQYKSLVLAFQTDRFTLKRRLEAQARARSMAESCVDKEIQKMADILKEQEKYCLTRDLQESNSSLLKQIEVLRRSVKRVSTQAHQDGCYQQESRMSSGVEVMIYHAENLTRQMERVSEDLDDLRKRDKLASECHREIMDGTSEQTGTQPLDEDKDSTEEDLTTRQLQSRGRQNSLLNFVLALHSTSVRAKEALRKFRGRSGADVDSSWGSMSSEREETDTELEQYESGEGTTPGDFPDVKNDENENNSSSLEQQIQNGEILQVDGTSQQNQTICPTGRGRCRRACGVATKVLVFLVLLMLVFVAVVVICAKSSKSNEDGDANDGDKEQ